jgi:hypothetical protein
MISRDELKAEAEKVASADATDFYIGVDVAEGIFSPETAAAELTEIADETGCDLALEGDAFVIRRKKAGRTALPPSRRQLIEKQLANLEPGQPFFMEARDEAEEDLITLALQHGCVMAKGFCFQKKAEE